MKVQLGERGTVVAIAARAYSGTARTSTRPLRMHVSSAGCAFVAGTLSSRPSTPNWLP